MTDKNSHDTSINDVPINKTDRKFLWLQGPRRADHASLTELGL
jgi:nuclear transport factor 2 (NTF2) superfamily protein